MEEKRLEMSQRAQVKDIRVRTPQSQDSSVGGFSFHIQHLHALRSKQKHLTIHRNLVCIPLLILRVCRQDSRASPPSFLHLAAKTTARVWVYAGAARLVPFLLAEKKSGATDYKQ